MQITKYPRTYHLPWSPGATRDDRKASYEQVGEAFVYQDILVTEKLDGSNVTMTREDVYSRGGEPTHKSFNWLKAWHARNRYLIRENIIIRAEYCYAVHSIEYTLNNYINIIGVQDSKYQWLSWPQVEEISKN